MEFTLLIILDTHIWVRWLENKEKPLPINLTEIIETTDQVAMSAVTCWEVPWLVRKERLKFKLNLDEWFESALEGSNVECIAIDREIAINAANLPEHHRDPADRLIIATAIKFDAQLLSLDTAFPAYEEIIGKLIQK